MASVWIARQTGGHGFEKLVAIKTILPKFAADVRFQAMFVQEARIASRIEHTNVAQILDVGEQDGVTYLVMEYVDGDSLSKIHRTLQKRGTLVPPGVVLRIMADVCGGLHAAHELCAADGSLLRVVHRDVSPQNVLVSTRGVAKLIDFGIAMARDRMEEDTASGPLKGKVRYMAPEQARGEAIDRRADLWAVGAVLYSLLSGRPPYDGDNEVATLLMLRGGKAPDPLPSSVHPAVASVVMRALGPLPESRFSTATGLKRAIENAMAKAKVETTTAGVAAFLAEHAVEGAQKRKAVVVQGLKALADRQSSPRVDEEMRPASPISAPRMSTIRPAAMEVAPAPEPRRRSWVLAVMVSGALGASGFLAMSRTGGPTHSADGNSFANVSAAAQSVAPPAGSLPSAGKADQPAVDPSRLPAAPAAVSPATATTKAQPVPHPRVPVRAPPRVPPTPAAPPKSRARARVDDGF